MAEQQKTPRWLEHITGDNDELFKFIGEGEHQQQDFKFRVDSSRKIARSLSAFANTDGGRLLIGVKDNGTIAGIDPEEEFYVLEGAAEVYCKPPIQFDTKVYDVDGKLVLIADIPRSSDRPHSVKEENDKWLAYIRENDENHLANGVLISYMKDKKTDDRSSLVEYGKEEKELFNYLSKEPDISASKFAKLANIPIKQSVQTLALFLKWEVIGWRMTDKGIRFFLKED